MEMESKRREKEEGKRRKARRGRKHTEIDTLKTQLL